MFHGRKFKYLHRENLWESSDEEADENPSNIAMIEISDSSGSNVPMNISVAAISSVVEETSSAPTQESEEQEEPPPSPPPPQANKLPYQPRTLSEGSRRYSILPAFPTSYHENQTTLLLANAPSMFE